MIYKIEIVVKPSPKAKDLFKKLDVILESFLTILKLSGLEVTGFIHKEK